MSEVIKYVLGSPDPDDSEFKYPGDYGFVRLVSYMQPVPLNRESGEEHWMDEQNFRPPGWTGDLEIVRNARVSYNADWRTGDDEGKDAKLINRMMKGKHSSPFEAMVFTFEVKAPIFVFRQWHRHRTWSYNEVSARYAAMKEEFYLPHPRHVGLQSTTDKQARVFISPVDGKPVEGFRPPGDYVPTDSLANSIYTQEKKAQLLMTMATKCEELHQIYRGLLGQGIPRELARAILPVNTYSRMFATVDLHNLFHFLRLRLSEHAQYEIRVYAQALLELITPICPVSVEAFKESLNVPEPNRSVLKIESPKDPPANS